MKLRNGQEFNNFKELCVMLKWIDPQKTLSTGSKRKLEKDLSQICSWEKIKGSNRILIIETYDEKKRRDDGRSKNNKYVDLIEKILIYELDAEDKDVYLSNSNICSKLGIFDCGIYEAMNDRSEFAQKNNLDTYVLTIFLARVRCEVNKIISRAMSSMIRNGILEAEKGIILITDEIKNENQHRMATGEEVVYIKEIEEEALNKLGCKNKGIASFRNLYKIFYGDVMHGLHNADYIYIRAYYEGYYITSINKEMTADNNKKVIIKAKTTLRNIVIERILQIGEDIHKKTVVEEYLNMGFGQPAFVRSQSNEMFVAYWKKIISVLWE